MLPKNGRLSLDGTTMDYIRFGSGTKTLLLLPGLGDGLQTVYGTALPMAFAYRIFGKDYTVYSFSRKADLPEGSTTRDMAADLKTAMAQLGIAKADVIGVSMGGMIAQHLAADYPQLVGKLVLTVTCPESSEIMTEAIGHWMAQAKNGDHTALMDSNVRKIYSDAYYRKNKWLIPIMGKLTKPKSYDRFLIQAQACLTHNCMDSLHRITAPTLVVGGEQDAVLGAEASRVLAANIPGAELKLYPQWGHGLYEEAKDFNETVLSFLNRE